MIHNDGTPWCLVTLGDYAVGKTSIIKALTNASFNPKEVTTIGMDPFQTTLEYGGTTIDVVIWDTAGQERFRSLVTVYSRRSHAALLVFDVTNKDSFRGIDAKLAAFLALSETQRIIILVANKIDLADECQVSRADARKWADEHNVPIIFTSAKTGAGIPDLKEVLARKFVEAGTESHVTTGVQLEERDTKTRQSCC
jgi:small GTP-binding protein